MFKNREILDLQMSFRGAGHMTSAPADVRTGRQLIDDLNPELKVEHQPPSCVSPFGRSSV